MKVQGPQKFLIPLGILIIGMVITAFVVFLFQTNGIKARSQRLNHLKERRLLKIENTLKRYHDYLGILKGFYESSTYVSKSEFNKFAESMHHVSKTFDLCWHSSDEQEQYHVGKAKSYCKEFDAVELNKIFENKDDLNLMISTFVKSRKDQKGFVSLVIPLQDLLVENEIPSVKEGLFVHNIASNEINTISINSDSAEFTKMEMSQLDANEIRKVAEESNLSLFYFLKDSNTEFQPKLSSLEWLSIFLIIAVSVMLSFLVYSISNQSRVANELVKTRTKELQTAINEAKKADLQKSEFLANMSHEIRTPLNGIVGVLNVLSSEIQKEDHQNLMNIALSSSDILMTVIGDILDFSKIEAGQISLESRPFNIQKSMDELFKLHTTNANDDDIKFSFKVNQDMPRYIIGDETRLKQIVGNLLSNSIKFTKKGRIDLVLESRELATKQIEIIITVADTGIGIAQNIMPELFKSFKQADNSTTRMFGGTGLGLSISKSIVQLMKGDIAVESVVGQGSTFTVTFPAETHRAPVKSEKTEHSGPRDLTPYRVLVAEDNRVNQVVISKMLKKLGVDFQICEDGFETLACLEAEKFDVILMDCHMPNLDGYETSKAIIGEPKTYGTPYIVAVTASVLPENIKKALDSGMQEVLSKPVQLEKLNDLFERLTHSLEKAS